MRVGGRYVREHMTRQYAQLTTMPVIADNCPGCFSAPTERAHIKQLMAAEEVRGTPVAAAAAWVCRWRWPCQP
jgi:hypothetical protein